MQACPWSFLTDNKKHIISLVGGGGKTTIMYELAAYFAAQDKRVVCMTTTHILQPQLGFAQAAQAEPVYAANFAEVRQLWERGCYAVIGTMEAGTGKLVAPCEEVLRLALQESDIVLIEADGAKHMPCKLPAVHEPVLLKESDLVIAVVGLDALGNTLEEVCFRWPLGAEIFASSCNALMDEQKLVSLLLSEQGSRKNVGQREYYIALNKCDLLLKEQAVAMRNLLVNRGMAPTRIWLRNLEE